MSSGFVRRSVICFAICAGWIVAVPLAAHAQLILNEANAVSADSLLQADDLGKPYEAYDYGALPHSGNNNAPNAGVNPGNPFPNDLDAVAPGNQQSLPNGWNLASATGWARILGNGGDWIELVVTEDHTDLRGYTLFWENDDGPIDGIVGSNPDERGFIKLTQDKAFADLRAGTIITMSEDAQLLEIRDKYPTAPPSDGGGPAPHNTGYVYDLSTNTSFDPFDGSDWHFHFHVDESITDGGGDTQYFKGFSDMKSDNDAWRMRVFDSTNTAIVAQAEIAGVISDLTTGLVHGPVGESAPNYGTSTGAGGINNQEVLSLNANPATGVSNAFYEDVDFSTFGAPNMFNVSTENILDGVQNFSALRNPVLANTYDWTPAGTANFGTAGNWQNDDTNATPGTGPQSNWTAELSNTAGGSKVAQVTSNTSIAFATVGAASGSMTLEVQNAATLNVGSGRVLVMDDGIVDVDGGLTASKVEVFAGGEVQGSGTVTGALLSSGGTVRPGPSGGELSVTGNYVQSSASTLAIELGGTGVGQSGRLSVSGSAALDGNLSVSLINGYAPQLGDRLTVLEFGSRTGDFDYLGTVLAGFLELRDFMLADHLELRARPQQDGDINLSGTVDIFDVGEVSDHWMQSGPLGDVNDDGSVDIFDVGQISDHWMQSVGGGTAAVPEPSTWILAMAGLALAAVPASRRRGPRNDVRRSSV